MNLEPWIIFVSATAPSTQSQMITMPRIAYAPSPSALASAFAAIAAGRRVLHNEAFDRYPVDNNGSNLPTYYKVSNHPDDPSPATGKWGLWIENGVAEIQQKWTNWFDQFRNACNGVVDHVHSSDEGWNLWNQAVDYPAADYPTFDFGNPLFWLPQYWLDQMEDGRWYTYQFWGRTMAEWLQLLGPTSSFPGDLPSWDTVDRTVASALYQIAWSWWQRKIVHDTVAPFFPECTFSDYTMFQMSRANMQALDGNIYPYIWNLGQIPGDFNNDSIYFEPPSGIPADNADFSTKFPWVVFAANFVRAIVRSSIYPVMMYVAPKHWGSASIYGTDYYDEAIIHIILSQGVANLIYFNAGSDDDELALNEIVTLTQSECLGATTIYPIAKEHVAYNSSYLASAVYLNDTHSGVARVAFAPGVDSVTFTLRGLEFPAERDGDELGAWVNFGPILHYDNWSFDQANAFTFDQVNILNFGGTRVMTLDDANALDLDQANALFE